MKKTLIAAAAAAVSAAVYALGPSMYSEPTFSQMERAIAAAKGEGYPTNTPSLYSKPTYSQMERLITAIGSGGGGGADTNSVRTLIDSSFDGGTQNVNRVVGSFDDVSNRKADKAANPTEGHIAALDANGNPIDSGKTPEDFVFDEKDVKFVYDETGTKRLDVDGKIYEAEVEIGGSWVHNWGSGSGKFVYKGHAYSPQYYAWAYNTITLTYNPSTGILKLPINGSTTNLQLTAELNPEKGDDFGGPYEIKGNTYTFSKQSPVFPETPTDSLLKRSTDVIDPATATTIGKAADALAVNTALAGKVSAVNGIAPVNGNVAVMALYNPNKTQKIDGNGDVYVAQFEAGGHWVMTNGLYTYELTYKGRKEGFSGRPYAWESSSKNQWVYYTPTSTKLVINGYHAVQDAPLNLNPESGDDIPGTYTYGNTSVVFTKQQMQFPDEPTDRMLKKSADLIDPVNATESGKAADALAVKNALSAKADDSALTPLSDEFYDLALDGEFRRMCVDMARTLGATVTNDVEEAAQP